MLSLVAASTSVTDVRLTLPGQQLAQAAAGLLNLLLPRAIVRLALFDRQEAKTVPAG